MKAKHLARRYERTDRLRTQSVRRARANRFAGLCESTGSVETLHRTLCGTSQPNGMRRKSNVLRLPPKDKIQPRQPRQSKVYAQHVGPIVFLNGVTLTQGNTLGLADIGCEYDKRGGWYVPPTANHAKLRQRMPFLNV